MALENIHKFALITKSILFNWTIMHFGMNNVTNTFSRTMTKVFGAYHDKFFKVFVDHDLNIHNMNLEDHLEHFLYVLLRLKEIIFRLNPRKCEFAKSKLTFLRHVVSCEGAQPNPNNIEAIIYFLTLTTIVNVTTFMGLIGYYWNYVKGYS